MVKDHSDNEKGNTPLQLHGLLFPTSNKASGICTIPQKEQYIPHLCYTRYGAMVEKSGSYCMFLLEFIGIQKVSHSENIKKPDGWMVGWMR